jgi:hypothetical protein
VLDLLNAIEAVEGGGARGRYLCSLCRMALPLPPFRWRRRRRRALRRRDPRRVFRFIDRRPAESRAIRPVRRTAIFDLFMSANERRRRRVTNCVSELGDSRTDLNPLPADHLSPPGSARDKKRPSSAHIATFFFPSGKQRRDQK